MMMRMIMMQPKMFNSTDKIFYILNKRYEYEQLVSYRKNYKLPSYDSDIESIRYFINNSYKSNRFRKNYKQVLALAVEIMEYYNEKTNLSGIHR